MDTDKKLGFEDFNNELLIRKFSEWVREIPYTDEIVVKVDGRQLVQFRNYPYESFDDPSTYSLTDLQRSKLIGEIKELEMDINNSKRKLAQLLENHKRPNGSDIGPPPKIKKDELINLPTTQAPRLVVGHVNVPIQEDEMSLIHH